MRLAIRILGLATAIFWTVTIVFFITAVYSATNFRINFGEPNAYSLENGIVTVGIPVFIENRGYYDVTELNVTTHLIGSGGTSLTEASTYIPIVPSGINMQIMHNLILNMNNIVTNDQNYLFNDTELNLNSAILLKYANAIPLRISTSMELPWGAPLYNFTMGQITYADYNQTHRKATIPISFENHSPAQLNGTIRLELYNSLGEYLGYETKSIDALPSSKIETTTETNVESEKLMETIQAKFYFQTNMFSYGPLEILQ